jgi:hypothetical protein
MNNLRPNITLSNGRVVAHRAYLSNGEPNGATEAYMLDNGNMSNAEWVEYCSIINPPSKPVKKPTWEQIKSRQLAA